MAIVSISREFGSGGNSISQNVAHSLGYLLVDKVLIDNVLTQYGMIHFEKIYESAHGIFDRFESENNELINMHNRTLFAFASLDNSVILGRGSYVLLSGYPNVLNVCIKAPFEARVKRVMKTNFVHSRQEAESLVRQKDLVRKSFLQTFYNVNCEESKLFHLTIDTERIYPDMAVKWIIEAALALDDSEPNVYQTTKSIDIDPVLAATVADVIAAYKQKLSMEAG